MGSPILKVKNLVKQFCRITVFPPSCSRTTVIKDVSFEVNEGEIVALLGGNGAGKSTTFDMLAGLSSPTDGKIEFRKSPSFLDAVLSADGEDPKEAAERDGDADETPGDEKWIPIMKMPLYRRAQHGIIYLPQKSSVFNALTVRQNLIGVMEVIEPKNLRLGMKLFEVESGTHEEFCDRMLRKFKLTEDTKEEPVSDKKKRKLEDTKAGSISGGERRKLEIARSFIRNPRLILMDEPYAALDEPAIGLCNDFFQEVKKAGVSILIVDHHLQDVLQIADWVIYLTKGQEGCIQGPPWAIVRHPKAMAELFSKDLKDFHEKFPIPDEVLNGSGYAVCEENRDWRGLWNEIRQRPRKTVQSFEASVSELKTGAQNHVSGVRERVPGIRGRVPGGQKEVPGGQKEVPGGQKEVPGGQKEVPGGRISGDVRFEE